ncbi:hypothetical protein M3Y95_00141400 [Aphelenchoides besseyi]|nr:hypothetical protein M3Y95_00141400 [Aphelenchoides besseyi]
MLTILIILYADIPPPQYTMICFELMNFMCWCAYFGLILIGRFKYKTQQVGFIGEKFQLSVQIRTLNVLKILGIYSAIKNLIDINVILLLDVWIRPKNIEGGERVVSFFYDLSLSLYALVVPLHMLISHPEMLRKLKEQFLHIKHQEERAFVFRNAVGESLTRPNANEHHFQELHVQWNSPQQNLQI